ncbi:MAG: hypothetical protein K2N41_04125 [Lachnospiraceae bacterium]|nr:hypothetical protein [Lachnospiraceae bacterium]MDE7238881.1 hypothetical protein [Lachnospiraceae bacterium]
MFFIFLLVMAVSFWLSVNFRLTVLHLFANTYYGIRDFSFWLYYRKWRVCKTGYLIGYTGLFGRGKTLSAVHYVVSRYKKYHGLRVYDFGRKKWVRQVVNVVSNVQLAIPYENLISLEQIVVAAARNAKKDAENNTLTITLALVDEASVQMNSRNFKTNIDPLFLNTLLTCRHHHISFIYTGQRFHHIDALLRQVSSYIVECKKLWRHMVQYYYDADELEHAPNPRLVKPYRRSGFFVLDRDYAMYDTLACVGNLEKSVRSGDMMTEEEILALRTNSNDVGIDGITKPSRILARRWVRKLPH